MTILKRITLLLCMLLSLTTTAQTDEIVQPFYRWDTPYELPKQEEVNTGIPLDSIFPQREIAPPVVRPSLFKRTTLPVKHDDLQERVSKAPAAWIFAALIVLYGLLFYYYNRNKLRLSDLLKAATDHRALDRLVRGSNLNTARLVPMGFFAICAFSTSIYLFALTSYGILAWLLLIVACTFCYLLCNSVTRLFGNVFDDKDAIAACISSNYIFHLIVGTIMAPLLMLQAYLPIGRDVIFYIIVSIAALEFIMRLFRGIQLFLTLSKSRSFYLFYYFCTIEVVPILVLIKLLLTQ